MNAPKLCVRTMKGKTVVVTGAGSGVGLETADSLGRLGASLVLVELDRVRGVAERPTSTTTASSASEKVNRVNP